MAWPVRGGAWLQSHVSELTVARVALGEAGDSVKQLRLANSLGQQDAEHRLGMVSCQGQAGCMRPHACRKWACGATVLLSPSSPSLMVLAMREPTPAACLTWIAASLRCPALQHCSAVSY